MTLSGVLFVVSIPVIALSHGYEPLILGRLLQGIRGSAQEGHPPVIHQAAVLRKPGNEVFEIVGPADAAKVGHPARHGHVAQVAATMDEHGLREQDRQQAHVHVIVRHLVDDPIIPAVVDGRDARGARPAARPIVAPRIRGDMRERGPARSE